MMLDQEKNFYLQGNQDFNDRQKTVFCTLDRLSAEQPEHRYKNEEFKVTNVAVVKNRKDLKQFLGQESIFKRPETPLKKCMKLRIPEFIKNPHKWKKYTLGDHEISDQSNRMVAMTFLKTLKKRTNTEQVNIERDNLKPLFNKYIKEPEVESATVSFQNEKPTFINGRTIMPEYVVGQKRKKEKEVKVHPSTPSNCVKLEHLFD